MDKLARSGAPELMSFKDGCAFLKVSTVTADRLLRHPRSSFPRPFRIGGRKFFLQGQLTDWLQQQAQKVAYAARMQGQKGRNATPSLRPVAAAIDYS